MPPRRFQVLTPPGSSTNQSRHDCHRTSKPAQVRNAVAYIRRIHAKAGEGGHNATFRAACKLRDAGLSEEEALCVLTDWNETNASPPWSAADLVHKIRSVYSLGR